MNKFDPHVGDTLCQIRAYKNYLLAIKNDAEKKIQVSIRIDEISKKIESLKKYLSEFNLLEIKYNSKYFNKLDKSEKIYNFLKKNDLLFNISNEEIYLLQSYILTEFSIVEKNISKGLDYKNLCKNNFISKTFAKKMMHLFQKNISQLSCEFIYEILYDSPDLIFLRKILPLLLFTDNDKRNIFPCYEVTKIIINHASKNRTPLIFLVFSEKNDREAYYFLAIPDTNYYFLVIKEEMIINYTSRPCIIIKGTSSFNFTEGFMQEFIHNIQKIGITTLLLSSMANHTQYPNKIINSKDENPYIVSLSKETNPYYKKTLAGLNIDFLIKRKTADDVGCSLKNPKLFLVKHIYSDTLNNISRVIELKSYIKPEYVDNQTNLSYNPLFI